MGMCHHSRSCFWARVPICHVQLRVKVGLHHNICLSRHFFQEIFGSLGEETPNIDMCTSFCCYFSSQSNVLTFISITLVCSHCAQNCLLSQVCSSLSMSFHLVFSFISEKFYSWAWETCANISANIGSAREAPSIILQSTKGPWDHGTISRPSHQVTSHEWMMIWGCPP